MCAVREQVRAAVQVSILPTLSVRSRAIAFWAWLLVAMVAAQSLGAMHTIVHATAAHATHQAGPAHSEAQGRAITTGWVAKLFAAHSDESDCRLYDQVSHGDCMPAVPLLGFPLQLTPLFLQVFEALPPLIFAALVQARGPPSIR